jgi:glycosyltransferase involved in cell wall biosynthesis
LILPDNGTVETTFVPSDGLWGRAWGIARVVVRRAQSGNTDLVHDHGAWLPNNVASAVAARWAGLPLVITPRGMVEPWALQHRAWKKTLAWHLYQKKYVLQSADLLHATSSMEARNLWELGLQAPIAVIPNGVELPNTWKQAPSEGDTRRALFLSRLHPKKGLPTLVDTWAALRPSGWELVIAGPDDGGHRAEVEQRVREQGIEEDVTFAGPVYGEDKWALYRSSDLFVLPTHSENFGVVIAEALASGVPVITTKGAEWSILEDRDCGWWIDIGKDPLVEALRDAMGRTDAERLEMGRRGRQVAEEEFSWDSVAERMVRAYRWLLGEGEQPSFVWREGTSHSEEAVTE